MEVTHSEAAYFATLAALPAALYLADYRSMAMVALIAVLLVVVSSALGA